MCFVALAKHMHTDRSTDANDAIYAFFTCSYLYLYP